MGKVPTSHTVTPASSFAEGHVLDACPRDEVFLSPMMQNPSKLSESGSAGKQGTNVKTCLGYSRLQVGQDLTYPLVWPMQKGRETSGGDMRNHRAPALGTVTKQKMGMRREESTSVKNIQLFGQEGNTLKRTNR